MPYVSAFQAALIGPLAVVLMIRVGIVCTKFGLAGGAIGNPVLAQAVRPGQLR